jgi:signal transduction histidine kinase
MCVALAVVMVVLFQSSAGTLIAEAQAGAERSCHAIAERYAKSLADASAAAPQLDLLQVLLQLVLLEAPHVEGGVWSASGGMLAYAYPTYEGSSTKRDVPEAEAPHIVQIAQVAARNQQSQTDVLRGAREALVVSACPLAAPGKDLAAWTMTRTPASTLAAQGSLRLGLGALLLAVVASGVWLGTILLRGLRHVQRLEAALAGADAAGGAMPALPRTGVRELDRVVDGFNHYRGRFEEAREKLRGAAQQQARDQRLAALGRMTGGIAHEIRNPIAAMRLKAENALAASPERQADALRVMLGQIARLDGLVQSLLAVVQPLNLQPQAVELRGWLAEHAEAFKLRAAEAQVAVELQAEALVVCIDPQHLGRALDNLLDNALRHTPRGGRVTVAAGRRDAAHWWLRVDDNGAGVAEALRAQLFEPFATGRADGTGLGLALAREVALAHGGDLNHVPLPQGARFEMELPWRDC